MENKTCEPLLTIKIYEDHVCVDDEDIGNPYKVIADIAEVRKEAKKIHEGDTVKIIDSGCIYSSNAKWVAEHITDKDHLIRFAYGQMLRDKNGDFGEIEGKLYKVIKIVDDKAYIKQMINMDSACYLIGLKGLKKC